MPKGPNELSDGTVLERGELIAVNPANQQLAEQMEVVFGALTNQELHNFTGTPKQVWQLMSLATGPDCKSFDELAGKAIGLSHFMAHSIEIENKETGELSRVPRVVLIDKDLKAYAFVSMGIAQDLARILKMFGLGPWNPPLQIQVKQFTTNNKRRMFTIQPA